MYNNFEIVKPTIEGNDYSLTDAILRYNGIKPTDIFKFATSNAATILGKKDVIGTIKENAIADIVVFDGDLENDFTNTIFKVKSVFKNGQVIR